ncbi:Putative endonuclease [Nitrosotalea devaniterrae]|uniref:Endonuclease n=1 Tax=Nitrosotalea devaniterrae TaxID=1078905 RepID=A0A128A1X5_9ARCH|nr:Putative endonuclease [Candidatus Nitrosotalea devanaterra]
MIQISLVGLTPVVVEEGLRKSIPEKLYIIHTKNESNYKFESEAKKLQNKIEKQYKILTTLLKVDAFDMDEIIRTILTVISQEKKQNPKLTKKDFAINITGGTKLMVAAASTAAYLAGSRVYYVMESSKYRGEDLVKELPMPVRPEDDNRGNSSRTTAIILEKIKKLKKCTNKMLLEEIRKDSRLKKNQRMEYHLKKLLQNDLITITAGWEKSTVNQRTGKHDIDYKKRTIRLTSSGEYYAEFPGLMGSII